MKEEESFRTVPDRSAPRKQQFHKNLVAAMEGLTLPLGEDCPKLYPVKRWVEMAEILAQRRKWERAAACWEQARRLGGTPDEVARYELELEYCQQQPAMEGAEAVARAERERKVREQTSERTLPDYIAGLPLELRENFRAAIDQIDDRRQFCEDNKIAYTDLGPPTHGEGERRVELAWFDMPLVWLLEAGVPRAMIEYQGDYTLSDPINPKTVFSGWIEIRGGSHCLWNDTRGWSIDPDEPTVLYPA